MLQPGIGVNFPLPTQAQQYAGAPSDNHTFDMVLYFERRQAAYDVANGTVTFNRGVLAAQGGDWGYGRPIMSPLEDIAGRYADIGGFQHISIVEKRDEPGVNLIPEEEKTLNFDGDDDFFDDQMLTLREGYRPLFYKAGHDRDLRQDINWPRVEITNFAQI